MFASQNRARSVWQSLYLVLNSWKGVQFIKRSSDLLYKGYKSSVNYDGEPSVSNGIVYQLPSSHLFIHRVLAKLSNRVVPYGVNYRKLQLLFVVWFLLTLWFCKVRFPADAYPASLNQSFRYDPRSMDLGQQVLFQNPAQFQKFLNLSRILEYCFALYFLCSQAFLPGFPPDIF